LILDKNTKNLKVLNKIVRKSSYKIIKPYNTLIDNEYLFII